MAKKTYLKKKLSYVLVIACSLSLLIHLCFWWFAKDVFSTHNKIVVSNPIVSAKLVTLAKKRDKKLLPRKPSAPKAVVKKKTKVASKKPHKVKAKAKAAPKAKIKKKAKTVKKNINVKNMLGKVTSDWKVKELASVKKLQADNAQQEEQSYEESVYAAIKSIYELPASIQMGEYKKLKVTVRLRINKNGQLKDAQIVESSKHAFFDSSVLRSLQKIVSFDPPPALNYAKYRNKGLIVMFSP